MDSLGSHGDNRALGGAIGGGTTKMGSFSLARQASIYSLTLEEFRNTLGEPGTNFGSMNMDEFLKNIWTAEESQAMAPAMAAAEGVTTGGRLGGQSSLQRQGSLTLPRTLSRKTVDEVWREIYRESSNDMNGNASENAQRQPTFGEMTLEDFLVKAGVRREEEPTTTEQYGGRFGNDQFGGFGGNSMERNDEGLGISNSLALGFAERVVAGNGDVRNNKGAAAAPGMASLTLSPANNALPNQAAIDAINLEALKASQHQQQTDWLNNHYRNAIAQQQQHHQLLQHQHQQQQVADAAAVYASVKRQGNGTMMGSGFGGALALSPTGIGNGLQGGLGVSLAGLGPTSLTMGAGSPANQLSSDGVGTSHGENSTVSPMPYGMDGGLRGRKRGGPVEKVIERRQRRMIKNRESAARSRARKQAYTVELEAEVTQLKEENRELRRKQEEMAERRKKQLLEMMAPLSQQLESKTKTLRRTQTGPW